MNNNKKIEIDVEIILETKAAYLVDDNPGSQSNEQWVPKSQIVVDYGVAAGDTTTMRIPEWLAKEKGFI
jgi:hypothetical protein